MHQHKLVTSGIKFGILPRRAAHSPVAHIGNISNKSSTLCVITLLQLPPLDVPFENKIIYKVNQYIDKIKTLTYDG